MHTWISEDRLCVLAKGVLDTFHVPGDMAEFGVWRGGSARVIASANPNKVLHLFDTFTGIPEDDANESGKHHKGDFDDCVLQDVKSYLLHFKVEFHVGVFPQSTKDLDHLRFSFVHIDCDTEQSLKAGMDYFIPRMTPGGLMVWDDYGWHMCPGVKKLVDQYFGSRITVGNSQAWVYL